MQPTQALIKTFLAAMLNPNAPHLNGCGHRNGCDQRPVCRFTS
jgi:hypothetical protein